VHVTDLANPAVPVNQGTVLVTVDDQTVMAQRIDGNGDYQAVVVTSLFSAFSDFGIFGDFLNNHTLVAAYSDPSGLFGPSSSAVTEVGIFFDFLNFFMSTLNHSNSGFTQFVG
jgi:hypothetical protein